MRTDQSCEVLMGSDLRGCSRTLGLVADKRKPKDPRKQKVQKSTPTPCGEGVVRESTFDCGLLARQSVTANKLRPRKGSEVAQNQVDVRLLLV